MSNINKLHLGKRPLSIGHLPSSYLVSLSYEEQNLIMGQKIDEIIGFINDVLDKQINDYITERFNDIMINAMYDEATETLTLYIDTQGGE